MFKQKKKKEKMTKVGDYVKQEYREAFTEVYEIFNLMPKEILNKIPNGFYEIIEENRDKEYNAVIKEPLEEQQLKDETILILGLIYRDFLCPLDERIELQKKDARQLKQIEDEIRKKYNPDNIFQNKTLLHKNIIKEEDNTNSFQLIEYKKESFIIKIINLFKKFLKRN